MADQKPNNLEPYNIYVVLTDTGNLQVFENGNLAHENLTNITLLASLEGFKLSIAKVPQLTREYVSGGPMSLAKVFGFDKVPDSAPAPPGQYI